MTTPTLALGISAGGAAEVAALAQAVGSLKNNLRELAQTSAGSTIGNMEALAKEFSAMRQELSASLQGLRTDVVAGFKQAFDAAALQARKGGEQVEGEVKAAAAKIRTAATPVMLGDGVKAMVSITGLDKESVVKALATIKSNSAAVAAEKEAAAAQQAAIEKKILDQRIRLIAGNYSIQAAEAESARREDDQSKKRLYSLMIGSAQYEQARLAQLDKEAISTDKMIFGAQRNLAKFLSARTELQAREEDADKKRLYSLMVGSAQYEQARLAQAEKEGLATDKMIYGTQRSLAKFLSSRTAQQEQEEASDQKRLYSLMIGSAKYEEARQKQLVREEETNTQFVFRTQRSLAQFLAARQAAREKEEKDAMEAARKQALLAEKEAAAVLDRAQRVEAAYAAMNARSQLRVQVRARSELEQGVAPETVQSRFGTTATAGAMSAASLEEMRRSLDDFNKKAPTASTHTKALTKDLADLHSASRGVASGFGAMWLTWGNIAPLLAGAALSHSFVQTIKMGSDVQQQFATIKVLSEETTQSVAALNSQMIEMARVGPFGPRQIAEAMKTLSLAGLDAASVSASIRDVLQFAVAGDTTIQKSADVLTTIGTAFKISTDSYGYIGDVIAKTAAVSKASIESISESFKTASVINSQYGVTLKDVGLGIAILTNVGVAGSAAGTALRNFYVDVLGRTPKVEKSFVELGLKADFAFDKATGKARSFVAIVKDLNEALEKKDAIGQTKATQDEFTERGGKGALEAIALIRSKLKSAKTEFANDLLYMAKQIEDSAGFMSISFAEMSLTATNQMKGTVSALQASLVTTFDSLQPYVLDVAQRLKQAFNSEEFQSTLQRLTTMVGQLTVFLVENSKAALMLGTVWLGFKAVGVITALLEVMNARLIAGTAALFGNAAAAQTAAAANNALAVTYEKRAVSEAAAAAATNSAATATASAASAFGTVLLWGSRLLGFLGLAVTAWQLYSFWSGAAVDQSKAKVNNQGALLEALKQEAARLDDINQAHILKISLEELSLRKRAEAARAANNVEPASAGADLKARAAQLEQHALTGPVHLKDARLTAAQKLRDEAKDQESIVSTDSRFANRLIEEEQARVRAKAAIRAKQVEDDMRARQVVAAGGAPYKIPGKEAKDSGSHAPRDNEMSTLDALMRQREAALRNAYGNEMSILEAKHRGELISEGTYQAEVLRMTEGFEGQSKGLLIKEMADMKAAKDARAADLMEYARTHKEAAGRLGEDLSNLENDYKRYSQNAQTELDKVTNDGIKRQALAVISLEAETKKLVTANDDYWVKAKAASAKEAELAKTRMASAGMSDEQRAAMEASTRVAESHTVQIEKLKKEYNDARIALSDFGNTLSDDQWTAETIAAYFALKKQVDELGKAAKQADANITEMQDTAAKSAVMEVTAKKANNFAKDISEALTDAIFEGGKDGGKKLKDWLKNYFIKEPLRIWVQAQVQAVMGGRQLNGTAGNGGVGGGNSGLGSVFNQNTLQVGSQWLGGTMSTANAAGTLYANATGAGIDGLVSATGGWGTMGGVATEAAGTGIAGSMVGAGGIDAAAAGWTTFGVVDASMLGAGVTTAGSAAAVGGAAAGGTAVAGTLAAAIPVIGWIVAIAALLYSVFGGKGGGPKTEGFYNPYNDDKYYSSNRPEVQAVSKDAAEGLQSQYDSIFKVYGGTAGEGVQFGLGYSADPAGKAQTAAHIGGGRNGQALFNISDQNIGREEEDLKKALEKMGSRAILKGLQASDLGGKLADYIRTLSIDVLGDSEVTKIMARVQKATTEKAQLELRATEMTENSVEKLVRTRKDEMEAVDETNRTLLNYVHKLQDVESARGELLSAYDREKSALESAVDATKVALEATREFAATLREFVSSFMTGSESPLSARNRTILAGATYTATLQAARAGDLTARGNLTNSATTYLENVKNTASDAGEYRFAVGRVMSDLTILAASTSSSASVEQQQLDVMNQQLQQLATLNQQMQELGLLNTTQLSFTEALSNYAGAKAAADFAKQAQATEAVTKAVPPPAPPAPTTDTWEADFRASAKYYQIANYMNLDEAVKSARSSGLDKRSGQEAANIYFPNSYYADGGDHTGGWRVVGEKGWEVESTGPSRIYNQQQFSDLLRGSVADRSAPTPQDDSLMRELLQEIRMLRSEAQATAKFSYETRTLLKEFRDRGMPVTNTPDNSPLITEAA